ncbi:site-2 protease family protein [Saccharibacillus sp. CPCC 101409]|uniref:site-2 protease family protein n=1 Tax=Saccharibacillus sp. CPCC 101409 TaxID=3058041 RepID=UPI002672B4C6|nr:site-2 protease family protein [Saccharibacillus sp. CPCC 101409]MDO3409154.1 site-2 protease family protein [Saccharibacillus sp. CPCC 101409]
MENFLAFSFEQLPFVLIVIMIAFTVHEFAHAYAAYKFGDPTAKLLGRVTLNPARHIDFFGLFLILVAGFGWARPVPVTRENFSRPRLMGIIVSAVGPLSNLLIAFIGAIVFAALVANGVVDNAETSRGVQAIVLFFNELIRLNVLLFLFNLIPLPPLDGYRILEDVAPRPLRRRLQAIEPYSIFIFLLLVFIPVLNANTIGRLQIWVYEISQSFFDLGIRLFG